MLMRRLCAVLAPLVLMGVECAPENADSPQKAAEFYGLVDGQTLTYDVTSTTGGSPTTSTHSFKASQSFADKVAYQREERNQANAIVETVFFESTIEAMRLLRVGDCLPNCTDYDNPPRILERQVKANTNYSSESSTTDVVNGQRTPGKKERHEITVGDENNVVTAAGTFKAFKILWSIFPEGGQRIDRELYFAPNKGFVQFTVGTNTYKLKSGVTP
ncbi:MAG: hypothetical protein AB2A00_06660 [Myxococcota bacterium]